MDKELFKIKMDKKGKEFGKVENLFNGLMIQLQYTNEIYKYLNWNLIEINIKKEKIFQL